LGAFAALAVVPASAQDTCCQGGPIIEGNGSGSDISTLTPFNVSDDWSQEVSGLIYMGLVGVDPVKAAIEPNQPGALAKDWDVSADGKTYTFHLRDDLVWSDGTPMTSADVMYAWNAIKLGVDGTIQSYVSGIVIDPTGATGIKDVTAPDDHTVVVTFNSAECTALSTASSLTPLPSHIMPTDLTKLDDWEGNLQPTVSSGPFTFSEYRPGELVRLDGSPSYKDATDGVVEASSYISKNTPDATVLSQQFIAGEANFIRNPLLGTRADIRATKSQIYDFPGNTWDYLALNLADPTNPQPAFDDKGNPIDQGHHPIFGDVRVRQALALAIDGDKVVEASLHGEGTRMASMLKPGTWANDPNLKPIQYDAVAAGKMLDEAGWIDDDNDPSTPRVAKGALYAPDGTPFTFQLLTNASNAVRVAAATEIQFELTQIGVNADLQTIDTSTMYDVAYKQTYDAVLGGWRDGYPDDPDSLGTQLFGPQSDIPVNGSDFTSYNNPEFNRLNSLAKSTPGCKSEDRATYYQQMAQIFQQDLPYIPLYVQNGMFAAGPDVQGFSPYPSNATWNIDAWKVNAS